MNDPSTTLYTTQFGNFTANFKELPPPIPQEYLLGMYTLAATVFTGWLVPNIARYFNFSMQKRHAIQYYSKINKNIKLDELQKEIEYAYVKGKISESQYKLLKERISEYPDKNKDN